MWRSICSTFKQWKLFESDNLEADVANLSNSFGVVYLPGSFFFIFFFLEILSWPIYCWWLFSKQAHYSSHFLFVNCPVKRPLPAFFVRVNTWSSITFDKSFFFFLSFFRFALSLALALSFFSDDEERCRNAVPSCRCENAGLALSHLCGSFTLGLSDWHRGPALFNGAHYHVRVMSLYSEIRPDQSGALTCVES